MPEVCTCGGHVRATDEVKSTIVQDIPAVKVEHVQHVAAVGECELCGKKVVVLAAGVRTRCVIAAVSRG